MNYISTLKMHESFDPRSQGKIAKSSFAVRELQEGNKVKDAGLEGAIDLSTQAKARTSFETTVT